MYKATLLYTITISLALTFFNAVNAHAQTYTYTASNANCSGQWSDEDCWDVTSTNCSTSATYPPNSIISETCESNIVINGNISYSGNITLGGAFSSITIADNSTFEITGDLTVDNANVDINLEGRNTSMNIGGMMTINNSDTVNIYGPTDLLESEDITTFLTANDLYLRGKSMLSIDENAGIDIVNETDAHTPSNSTEDRATIDVDGIYYSTSVKIRGNSHLAFILTETAEVIASEPEGILEMNGNSTLTFIGDFYETGGDADGESYATVGGQITTNGSGALIKADDATIITCYTFPDKITKEVDHEGKFEEAGCKLLPVVWNDISGHWNSLANKSQIQWSTAKEWENSHFEIERSINNIEDFKLIGKINAVGWSDKISNYQFNETLVLTNSPILYYRIKQVNLNGTFAYSPVIAIKTQSNINHTGWRAFPNPSDGTQLSLASLNQEIPEDTLIEVKIYSSNHISQVLSQKFNYSSNINLDELINKLGKGVHIIEINWQGNSQKIKLLKQ
ncbi:T9SS type A sorting domain-containing protein [Echinicola salinicaeni]|uniref:T9SS type A sorting domain-containing protein n=1 Tax=Echinicola salinicaeni TaxID=2762757 RepID=UPI001644B1CF|nr:T9SS type A sorting domain-containing protein [Echinicola salinicaeni]